jgi:hypothetical protein
MNFNGITLNTQAAMEQPLGNASFHMQDKVGGAF